MARLTIGQKCTRFLHFLLGLRDRRIVAELARYGFDQAAFDEGWTLLRKVAGERLDATPAESVSPQELVELDAWENLWFPICSAVLRRHFPALHDQVFHNLVQTEGAELVISVGTLLGRLDALGRDLGQGALALAMLRKHGVTDEVLGQARTLIDKATRVTGAPDGTPPTTPPDDSRGLSEEAMWNYYLQWSAIARSVITDRRQLRQLGFLKPRRGGAELPEDDTEPTPGEEDAVDAGAPALAARGASAPDMAPAMQPR